MEPFGKHSKNQAVYVDLNVSTLVPNIAVILAIHDWKSKLVMGAFLSFVRAARSEIEVVTLWKLQLSTILRSLRPRSTFAALLAIQASNDAGVLGGLLELIWIDAE